MAEGIEDGFEAIDGLMVYWRRYSLRGIGAQNNNHKHPDGHDTTIDEGSWRIDTQGQKPRELSRGETMFIPAHTLHQFTLLTETGAYTCRNILRDERGERIPEKHNYTETQLRGFTQPLIYYTEREIHPSVVGKKRRLKDKQQKDKAKVRNGVLR
jgi:hypothetical protein